MVLILSDYEMDETTALVMDWLEHLGVPYKRVNGRDLVNHSTFTINCGDHTLQLENESFSIPDIDEISKVWNRKWLDGDLVQNIPWPEEPSDELVDNVKDHIYGEFAGISRYFFKRLKEKEWLTQPPTARQNHHKLDQLDVAKRVGLSIPETIITNTKESLYHFVRKHGNIISKSISNALIGPVKEDVYMAYTIMLDEPQVDELPDRFYPSLFQQAVEKEFEIRTFYLHGECYSMAMFSQGDEQTKEDFRQYNFEKPNRFVPFNLPPAIAKKCDAFMQEFGLNCGSLDLIRTPQNEYYFLEVNPTGQFGMVSFPCNYHLEEKVAEVLAQ
ncbi:MAG: grasp-with-spasm system ATP-grasp peptide maturase [Bacteroidota bacterium]